MLWSTYESEKHFERRSKELDRKWKLLQGNEGNGEKSGKLIRRMEMEHREPEQSEMPRMLQCSNCCNVAQG